MEEQVNTTLKQLLKSIIQKNLTADIFAWLQDRADQSARENNNYQLNLTFASLPRKTGKKTTVVTEAEIAKMDLLLPGFSVQQWSIDRLSRVWLLMQLEATDKENYINRIENLFPQAEMNELAALYSSLPLLAYPEAWKLRCAEGIRSNIGTVLEAIMYNNPYPAAYLDEPAWNQLVMKAFFTDKNVNRIIGLDERANRNLANILFDYAEERRAAHRTVNPQLWRLTGKFLDEQHFFMMEKLFTHGNETDQQSAALACASSSFEKATLLLDQYPEYKNAIEQNTLNWELISYN